MPDTVRGSCLCGGVRFEVEPPFIRANHWHCSRCRKHSGTTGCTQTRVWKEQFRLLQGREMIRVYGAGEGAAASVGVTAWDSTVGPPGGVGGAVAAGGAVGAGAGAVSSSPPQDTAAKAAMTATIKPHSVRVPILRMAAASSNTMCGLIR